MQETIQDIAIAMVAPGKGILAADESTPTIGKRLAGIEVENTEENQIKYRGLLFTTPEIEKYISGVIMYDETLHQSGKDGVSFPELLKSRGIIPGIKVDMGTEFFEGSDPSADGEKYTKGLDGLDERLKEYYKLGARFAKWRATFSISDELPTDSLINKNAEDLAEYAFVCQQNNIVPIVEPEVLMDGDHTIERCFEVTKQVLQVTFEKLKNRGVQLDGVVLKPNMVIAGQDAQKDTPETVADMTVKCFREVVPKDVSGIVFLSGGQTERQACENLNAMNSTDEMHPWELSFSYGRALQASTLKAWLGKDENIKNAQEVFLHRCKMTSMARSGEYSGDLEN
ncbi:MAG: fructose-bisphosphate aldolase class I [Candidatus Magasanikbacteria bacterium]|jgi:fructose-bisphosphate aldolase, class I|nr:fructose-bisphosphate aldolase class I [Candidatus Magasanikbacteria bacterium]MBT4314584.1 fructose-bisphosphate aldolase class I [Candidatus Magasanikbacteria bacterium]MBT4546783.1 fructose-bisphosphate aldolase class I [Candidatus Magasanikbacteria bacterium]MBT6818792.1 fructose-bisphosphate aldolase class I [Candidatus Magasanikbacteria bacterium]